MANASERSKGEYSSRWDKFMAEGRDGYEAIKASYNARPNGSDLVFLCRACYGGVVRFRQKDGHMSTPCGVHMPITPEKFGARVDEWHERTKRASFLQKDFRDIVARVGSGDVVYCDPPYSYSQTILYRSQGFDLAHLLSLLQECKARGAYVALSIDGSKRSGTQLCDIEIPEGLFERELFVDVGRSMLRRFQMGGGTLEGEQVKDRLLLSY
jgi:DNA adenine methylase